MNIFDLDQSSRYIKSSLIRRSLADRYNREDVHTHLWRSLREAAGIPRQPHKLTKRESWKLICAGMAYFESGKILSGVSLNKFANQCIEQWGNPDEWFNAMGEPTYTAQEVLDAIVRETGRSPHPSTLYRWRKKFAKCPAFRPDGTYTASQLTAFVNAARKSAAAAVGNAKKYTRTVA